MQFREKTYALLHIKRLSLETFFLIFHMHLLFRLHVNRVTLFVK